MERVDRSHHPKPHFLISVVPANLNSILKTQVAETLRRGV